MGKSPGNEVGLCGQNSQKRNDGYQVLGSAHSLCLMKANFPGAEFSRKIFKFKKRKINSPWYVQVVDKTCKVVVLVT